MDALGHDLVHHDAKAASCTEVGRKAYDTCSRCSYSTYEEIAALGHDYNSVVTAPTCTEGGYTTHTCSRCNDSYTDSETTAAGHNWGEWKQSKAPTCTEKGAEVRTCTSCKESQTRDVDALGHDLVHHDAKAASCTDAGWKAYDTCSRCSYTTYEEIAALGHDYNSVVTAPTCTEGGYTTHTCSRCNDSYKDIETKATGHDWGEWTVTAHATEKEEGVETRTCSRCDEKQTRTIPKLNHTHQLTKMEAKAATCTADGNTAYWTCSGCEKFFSDAKGTKEITKDSWVVKAVGHNWSAWSETTPATEQKEGVEARTCSRCDQKETRAVPKLSHTHSLTKTDARDATCTANGNKAYWTCSGCGSFFSDAEGKTEIARNSWVVKAVGHTPGKAVRENEVAATCVAAGSYDEVVCCSSCGEELSRETKSLKQLDHIPAATVIENEIPATETASGSYDEVVYCSVCGEELSRKSVEIPMLTDEPVIIFLANGGEGEMEKPDRDRR